MAGGGEGAGGEGVRGGEQAEGGGERDFIDMNRERNNLIQIKTLLGLYTTRSQTRAVR